jgi:hypothetical protein
MELAELGTHRSAMNRPLLTDYNETEDETAAELREDGRGAAAIVEEAPTVLTIEQNGGEKKLNVSKDPYTLVIDEVPKLCGEGCVGFRVARYIYPSSNVCTCLVDYAPRCGGSTFYLSACV